MEETAPDPRFERLWTRAVIALVALITLYFVITEFDGIARFVTWFTHSLAAAPDGLRALAAHYAELPPAQLMPSLLISVLVGFVGALSVGKPNRAVSRGMVALVSMGLSMVSGQILTVSLRHCTYAAELPAAQVIAGGLVTAFSALILPLPYWLWLRARRSEAVSGVFKRPLLAYLLLLPSLASLLLFLYYPALQTALLSLNIRRFPLPQERFVCLANYTALTEDVIYQSSFAVTLFVTIAVVLLSLSIALGIALLASQKIRGASIYRTLLIWPFALSPVVTGVLFLSLFREGNSGIMTYLINTLFGVSPSWLRDPVLARWVIVAASVWNILGFNILFYIAGLQNVPKDLLEAAQIDGANRAQRFFTVTFPLLTPFTFFLLITNVTYSFYGIYGAIDALTQGGPPIGPGGQFGGATNVLIYKLYSDAFTPGAPAGLAAAQAVILFAGVAGLTLLQFRYVERRVTYAN